MTREITVVLRNRRGIALPFALIGLVAISILVTTVLLTSSSEFAISNAHRDAARSLYQAESAMEGFLAASFDPVTSGWALAPGAAVVNADGQSYAVEASRLTWEQTNQPNLMRADETFSLVSSPVSGRGRSLVSFIQTVRTFVPANINVTAGTTSGGNLNMTGNATISSGEGGTAYCQEAEDAEHAIMVTAGSTVNVGGSAEVIGGIDNTSVEKDDLADFILQGKTIEEMAEYAEIKFGVNRWGADNPNWNTQRVEGTNTDLRLNWGCPAAIMDCPEGALVDRHVVVAIDAGIYDAEGVLQGFGSVSLNGRHGQGMLIVLNGNLTIQGNFVYKGIILVERDMDIQGGSAGNETKIEGAVVAFGDNSTVTDNVRGTATIVFNKCAIIEAQHALNQGGLERAPQALGGRTFAWHEVIQ
jgi:hypothetical protein